MSLKADFADEFASSAFGEVSGDKALVGKWGSIVEEAKRDHRLQREADMRGEAVRLWHPTHPWVLETIEPEVT